VSDEFAKRTFSAWFDNNCAQFAQFINSSDLNAPDGRAAWAQLDLPMYTVGISAWDQGNRLEVIVIDASTGDAKVEDKEYADSEKMKLRLSALLTQLQEMLESLPPR